LERPALGLSESVAAGTRHRAYEDRDRTRHHHNGLDPDPGLAAGYVAASSLYLNPSGNRTSENYVAGAYHHRTEKTVKADLPSKTQPRECIRYQSRRSRVTILGFASSGGQSRWTPIEHWMSLSSNVIA